MGLFSLPLSIILGCFIILIEIIRQKYRKGLDFLTGINAVYLICFSIAPIFLLISDLSNLMHMGWIVKNSFESPVFLYVSLLSIIGYIFIINGYFFSGYMIIKNKSKEICDDLKEEHFNIPEIMIAMAGSMFFILGLAALIIYIKSIGGFVVSIKYAQVFRSDMSSVTSKWSFLKNITPSIQMSSYFFYGLYKEAKGKFTRSYACAMLIVSFIITVYILYHNAGRRSMVSYFLVFLLARFFENGKISVRQIIAAVSISLLIILFGDSIFVVFQREERIIDTFALYTNNPAMITSNVLLEFSFPFVTLGNAVTALNCDIDMRFFYDIPLAFLSLIPNKIFRMDFPKGLSVLNTELFNSSGAIPVDIVSFGYFSLGIAGVMIYCFLFGVIVKAVENSFVLRCSPVQSVFKAKLLITLAFVVMYGEPEQFIKGNFTLFLAIIALAVMSSLGEKAYETKAANA